MPQKQDGVVNTRENGTVPDHTTKEDRNFDDQTRNKIREERENAACGDTRQPVGRFPWTTK